MDLLTIMGIDIGVWRCKPRELQKVVEKGNQTKERAFWKGAAHLVRGVGFCCCGSLVLLLREGNDKLSVLNSRRAASFLGKKAVTRGG